MRAVPAVADGTQISITHQSGPPQLREQLGPSAVCQSCDIRSKREVAGTGGEVGLDGYMLLKQRMAAGLVCVRREDCSQRARAKSV